MQRAKYLLGKARTLFTPSDVDAMISSMQSTIRSLAVLVSLCCTIGASRADPLPAGTRYQCFDPKTNKKEASQQQFTNCKGVQTRITPGGASTIIAENVESTAPPPHPLVSREDRIAATLLAHFPDEAAHRRARERAIAPRLETIARIERQIREALKEREPIAGEFEFYIRDMSKLPDKDRRAMDANDAKLAARKQALQLARDDLAMVTARYDVELATLRGLWAPRMTR